MLSSRRDSLQAGTDRALGAQLRDKAKREAAERARDEAELAAVLAARAAADAHERAREEKAAAERRALSDAIRAYNECVALLKVVWIVAVYAAHSGVVWPEGRMTDTLRHCTIC
jgi:leucyl aminopeptidase (aminopeptidase T)